MHRTLQAHGHPLSPFHKVRQYSITTLDSRLRGEDDKRRVLSDRDHKEKMDS